MKKRFLATLLALALVLALLPTTAVAAEGDFTIENGVLTKYNGSGGDVVIPNGVTGIGAEAFLRCTNLTSVTIPDGVTSIGDFAFSRCAGLTGIVIPDSVASIGVYAFAYCGQLDSVTIPGSVARIEEMTFGGCAGLTDVTISNGVTSIGGNAFAGCKGLTDVTIPASVIRVKEAAFYDCASLLRIQVGPGNQSYLSIDGVLFTRDGKTLVAYPGGRQGAYTIPGSVTCIGDYAFHRCTGLDSVTIPDSVTSIGASAFYGCTALIGVKNSNNLTSIGDYAFVGCKVLANVTIPHSVASIGKQAFGGCASLTSVFIPDGVTRIEKALFFGCTSLTSVTIPNSVTSIESYAFSRCVALSNVHYTGTAAQWEVIAIDYENEPLTSAAIHFNSTGPGQPSPPQNLPAVEDIPATGTAVARTQAVKLDGKDVEFQCYAVKDASGNESNYVKVRDLAMALSGTEAQFNVGWDGKISITSNIPYHAAGGEGTAPYSGDQSYKAMSSTPVSFNGSAVNLTSFSITYQGGGYTYYKLRDLGQLLNFNVKWDGGVVIETDKPYTGQ